jgi:hypothetical protein
MVKALEKILREMKIGKTGLLGLALVFGDNYYQAKAGDGDIEQGKVVVSLKCIDAQGNEPLNRKIKPSEKYQLQVIGDNRGMNAKTVQFEWFSVSIPYLAGLTDIPQPNPKYEGDFFREENSNEKFVMSRLSNKVGLEKSFRYTRDINTPEGFMQTGPTNRVGILGIYSLITLQESLGHQINFSVREVRATGGPGIIHQQPTKIKNLSVVVVTDPTNEVGVIIERNYDANKVKIEILEAVGKTSVVEYTTNLASGNWIPIVTNTVSGKIFEITESIDSSLTSKFYRARVLQ